jgi:PAS domain S-box-containing protein
MKIFYRYIVIFILLSNFSLYADSIAIDDLSLTEDELTWLGENHKVRVAVGRWAPYEFYNDEDIEGISIDLLEHMFKSLKIDYELIPNREYTWAETLEEIKNKRSFDLLTSIRINEDRAKYLLFTTSHLSLKSVIFTRKHSNINSITDLYGETIYLPKNFVLTNILKEEHPLINVIELDKKNVVEHCMQYVSSGKSVAYIGDLTVGTYAIQSLNLSNMRIAGPTGFDYSKLVMGVRNDWPELVSIISKYIDKIPDTYKTQLINEYITVRFDHGITLQEVIVGSILTLLFFGIIIIIYSRGNKKLKRAFELKNESDIKFKSIFNKTPNPVGITSVKDNFFVDINHEFLSQFGYSAKEIIGKNAFEIGLIASKSDYQKFLVELKGENDIVAYPINLTTKSGELLKGLFYSSKVKINNTDFYLSSFTDITMKIDLMQKTESFLAFSNLILNFTTTLINIDSSMIDIAFRKVLKEIGEYLDADRIYIYRYNLEEYTATKIYEWHNEDYEHFYKNLKLLKMKTVPEIIETHKRHEHLFYSNFNEDAPKQSVKWMENRNIKSLTTVPIFDSDDKLIGFIGATYYKQHRQIVVDDFTLLEIFAPIYANIASRIKRDKLLMDLNKELTQKTKIAQTYALKAQEASKAKSDFLANMSHEIRTPINSMIGYTDLVLDTSLNSYQRHHLEHSVKSAKLLLNLVNDILDISKIESKKLAIAPKKTNILLACSDLIDIFRLQSFSKNIEFYFDYSTNIPKYIVIDEFRFKQIMMNFLSNAFKFTKKGHVSIIINFVKISSNRGTLKVEIADTGIGISDEKKKVMFKMFSQADNTMTRDFGGAGLGLNIAERLAKLMGGSIKFESVACKGSNFYFDINVDFLDENDEAQNVMQRKILINTDNPRVYDSLKKHIEINGDKILPLREHCRLLEQLENNEVDIIIFYHNLNKEICSEEVFNKFVQKIIEKDIHIISYYSNIESNIKKKLATIRNCTFIKKPANPYILIANINNGLPLSNEEKEVDTRPSFCRLSDEKYSILVVDDNKLNRKLIGKMLKKYLPAAEITIAVNGLEAVTKTQAYTFDMIFMDLQMPVMDGVTATKEILKLPLDVIPPIVALTANATKEDERIALQAGMVDFMAKPIDINKLINVLVSVLKIGK